MINIQSFIENCRNLVVNTGRPILIIETFQGCLSAYITESVKLKTRDNQYNEVFNARNISTIIQNFEFNFVNGINEQALIDKIQSLPKESFKWGHDNYVWITNADTAPTDLFERNRGSDISKRFFQQQ